MRWFDALTGRIGYSWQPNSLLYFQGGAVWSSIEADAFVTTAAGTFAGSASTTKTGWTIGGGWEYQILAAVVVVYRRQLLRLRLARWNYIHPRRLRLCVWLCFPHQDDCGHGPHRCELQIRGIWDRVINSLTQSELQRPWASSARGLLIRKRDGIFEETASRRSFFFAKLSSRKCPLLALSGHWLVRCTCLLLTRSGLAEHGH